MRSSSKQPHLLWNGHNASSNPYLGIYDSSTGLGMLKSTLKVGTIQAGAYDHCMKGVPTRFRGINHDVLLTLNKASEDAPVECPANKVNFDSAQTVIAKSGSSKKFESYGEALELKDPDSERIVVVVPHDDDALLGIGATLYTLAKEGYKISLVVCTDGSRGYCKEDERSNITSVRQLATFDAYGSIGINDITFLNFPDASTEMWHGNRTPTPHERLMYPHLIIDNSIGLMNSLVNTYRKLQPTTLILTSNQDHHTDHVNVYTDALFAAVQGAEDMWPNKGSPFRLDRIFQYGVRKNLELTDDATLEVMSFNSKTWDFKFQAMGPFNGTQENLLDFVYAQFREPVNQYKVGDFEVLQEVRFGRGPSLQSRLGRYPAFVL